MFAWEEHTITGYALAQLEKIRLHRAASLKGAVSARRHPERAALERAHGYDTKHAMHLVRLMRMGLEALQCGELRVRRDDAAELAAIRDGALSFDELLALSEQLQEAMAAAARASLLPAEVDLEQVDELLVSLVV